VEWDVSRGALLVFDGDCAFCTSAVNRLKAMFDVFPQSEPWQWLDYESLGLSFDDVTRYAWVLTPTRKYGGHLAFAALMRLQPQFGWRFLGTLIATPPFSWAAALGYLAVSKNRSRLPGGTPACALPPAAR
jgi:predicted DCC family thiol-disulfide oxidoreductase YuxK